MKNYSKGMAMLIVITLVLLLLILGGTVLLVSTGHFGTSFHQIKRARAYYAAEAALQHVLWKLWRDRPSPQTLPSDFKVNRIEDEDVSIALGNPGAEMAGVQRIDITISY